MNSEKYVGKDVAVSGCGLIWGTSPAFACRDSGKPLQSCQHNWFLGQDLELPE
jgi:hypothetical protein